MRVDELIAILEKAPPDFEVSTEDERICIWKWEGTGRKRRDTELKIYCDESDSFVDAIRFDLGVN